MFIAAFYFAGFTTDAQTVYITKTGKCYHKSTCSFLKSSVIAIELANAKERYIPCTRCQQKGNVNITVQKTKTSNFYSIDATATGKPIYIGPRGGRYHYNKSGKKVYEKKRY